MGAKIGGGAFDDINMTPMIDIVLVVLIIMMVNIPVAARELGVKVPGPPKDQVTPPNPDAKQLVLALYEDKRIALNRTVVVSDYDILASKDASEAEKAELLALTYQVTARLKSMAKKNVFVDAHPDVPFGVIVDAIDMAKEAGAVDVGLAKLKDDGPLEPTSVGSGAMPRGVFLGSPSTVGYITEKVADATFRPALPAIKGCYTQALGTNSGLTGRILLRFDVQYQGEVMEAAIDQDSIEDETLSTCIQTAMESVAFQPLKASESDKTPDYERTARVIYPLLFSPG